MSELGIDLSMPSLLSFLVVGGDTSSTTGFVYDWDTDKLGNWPGGDFGFQFKNTIRDGGPKAELRITGGVELELAENAKPVGYVRVRCRTSGFASYSLGMALKRHSRACVSMRRWERR